MSEPCKHQLTTTAAANLYLAQHLLEMEGRPNAVFNPHNKPADSLPVIFGFNNGGQEDWLQGVLLAEDGTCLGGHTCSNEGYMRHDLGILEGSRPDRHAEQFQKHYPDGYRMAFVPYAETRKCEPLLAAIRKNQEQKKEAGNE